MGRSRGGFTTKIHILCDRDGRPLAFRLTPGQAHETTALEELLKCADDEIRDSDDNRVTWPVALAGDKGYRAEWIDNFLLALGITPVVPSKANEDRAERQVEFDKDNYRDRNIVERLIGWLKESRRILTRFEKTAVNYAGMIKLAFIHRYFRLMEI